MKSDIHPEYNQVVFHDVSSDYKLLTRSTMTSDETIKWEDGKTYPLVKVEISSASHSFYTGKQQQIAERGGRIEQFRRRYGTEDEPEGQSSEEGQADADPASASAGATTEATEAQTDS